jgi:hypothetical protein
MSKQPFGTVLGTFKGVEGFSNGKVGRDPGRNYLGEVFTGYKYQCVEFARRWMVQVKGLTFESIGCAFQIWDLDFVLNVNNGERSPLIGIANGSCVPPVPDALLIYEKGPEMPAGHVAVITDVDLEQGWVRVAEQNENDRIWPGDYARQLAVQMVDQQFWMVDKYEVIGWMVYEGDLLVG